MMCAKISFHHYCRIVFMNTFAIDSFCDHHIRKKHLNLKNVFLTFALLLILAREHLFWSSFFFAFFWQFFQHVQNKRKASQLKTPSEQFEYAEVHTFFEENTIFFENGLSFLPFAHNYVEVVVLLSAQF